MNDNVEYVQRTVLRADGSSIQEETPVIKEHTLIVVVNGQELFRIVCIRENLRELVVGRLFTEGLINSYEDIIELSFCRYEWRANVILDMALSQSHEITAEPTCCAGNKVLSSVKAIRQLCRLPEQVFSVENVFKAAEEFSKGTFLHSLTRGTHSCFLLTEGNLLYACEDIGRHNAVDKAVGYGIINRISLSDCMIFTSGRIPVDMVQKVIAAGIPVLISKSVPTIDSIEMAKEFGLKLICGAYKDQIEIY